MATPPSQHVNDTSTLCTTCKTIGPWNGRGWKDFHTRETLRTHLKWMNEDATLQRSVSYEVDVERFYADAETCSWCFLLMYQLRLPPSLEIARDQGGFKKYDFGLDFCAPEGLQPSRINVLRVSCIAGQESGFVPYRTRLSILARPDSIASKVFLAPRVTNYENSQFNHELAKEWIDRCTEEHKDCKIVTKAASETESSAEHVPLLPTRILEITPPDDDSQSPIITLRDSASGETGNFICLSYTWGPHSRHDFPKIARSLLAQHESDPSESATQVQLPAVFTDAAHVALKLGIKHLWIDALCIWQDDSEDLKAELSQIHRYYSEATVVVQSSGTRSVDEHFLGETRNSEVAQELHDAATVDVQGTFLKIPYIHDHFREETDEKVQDQPRSITESDASEDREAITENSESQENDNMDDTPSIQDIVYVCPSENLPEAYEAQGEPAADRGWIFQEQNLCRRLLTFPSGGGMMFTCDSDLLLATVHSDGQVNQYAPRQFESRRRRAGAAGTWRKEKLMGKDQFPGDIQFIPFNDRLLVQFDQMRKLAMLGNKPEMVFHEGGGMVLNLNLTPDDIEERNRKSAEAKTRKMQGIAHAEKKEGALLPGDLGYDQTTQKAIEAAPEVDVENNEFTSSDDSEQKNEPHRGGDEDSVQSSRALMEHLELQDTEDEAHIEQVVGHEDERNSKQEEEEEEEEDDDHTEPTRFQTLTLVIRANLNDGTFREHHIPPNKHPFLQMSRGERSMLIATGPWNGSIFASGLMESWGRLVNEYCARRLTNPQDKLVAMAALASAFEEQYGREVLGEYHAGIWQKFAGEGLLWFASWRKPKGGKANRPRVNSSRDTEAEAEETAAQGETDISGIEKASPEAQHSTTRTYAIEYDERAPSWSWAAVHRASYPDPKIEIENGVDYMDLDFTVLAVETTPADNSPARGAVVGGSIRISGLVMDVWWAMSRNGEGEEVVHIFTEETGGERVGKYGSASPDHEWLYPGWDKREHVLLLLGRRFVQGIGHNEDHEGECLLLRPREGYGEEHVAEDEYVRVGFAGPVFFDFHRKWRSGFRQVELTIY